MEGSWDGIAGCVVHVAVQVKKLLTAGYEAKGHTRYIFGGAEPPKLDNKGGWSPLAPPPPFRRHCSEPTWEAVKFLNFRGEDALRPPGKLLHFAWKLVQT